MKKKIPINLFQSTNKRKGTIYSMMTIARVDSE